MSVDITRYHKGMYLTQSTLQNACWGLGTITLSAHFSPDPNNSSHSNTASCKRLSEPQLTPKSAQSIGYRYWFSALPDRGYLWYMFHTAYAPGDQYNPWCPSILMQCCWLSPSHSSQNSHRQSRIPDEKGAGRVVHNPDTEDVPADSLWGTIRRGEARHVGKKRKLQSCCCSFQCMAKHSLPSVQVSWGQMYRNPGPLHSMVHSSSVFY